MRRLVRAAVVTGCVALASAPAHAQNAPSEYPVADGYVVDTANALGSEPESALEDELRQYEARTGNQVAVAVVPTLGGRTIEQYSTGLFNAWGVGQAARDNGVLLVVATEDRKLRIEVGEGLLDELPDQEAESVVEREIVPRLRAGDIEGGVRSGTIGIRRALDDDVSTPDAAAPRAPASVRDGGGALDPAAGDPSFDGDYPGERFTVGGILVFVVPIALLGFALTRLAGGSDRCPNCSRALAWGGPARRGGFDHCDTCGFGRQRGFMGGVGFGSALLGGMLLGSGDRRGPRADNWGGTDSRATGPTSSGSAGGSPFGGGSSGGGGASGSW